MEIFDAHDGFKANTPIKNIEIRLETLKRVGTLMLESTI